MHINDAIALCHILDDFEEFNKNAIEFVDNENKNVLALRNWAEGDTLGANVVAKQFYENNKALIDKIHQYTDEDLIIYKSIGSNYLMKLHFYQTFSKYRVITLNSLLFDVNNLPKEELTFYETVQKIIVSKKENENIDKFIRNAVSLECALLAMTSVINKLDGIIQNLSKVEDKDKVLELSAKAKDSINGLSQFLEGFEERELKENNISKKVLEEQKLLYQRNKENN